MLSTRALFLPCGLTAFGSRTAPQHATPRRQATQADASWCRSSHTTAQQQQSHRGAAAAPPSVRQDAPPGLRSAAAPLWPLSPCAARFLSHPAPFSGAHLAQQPRSLHLHVEEALLHSFFATLFTWRPCHTLHVEEALSRGPFRLKYCFTLQGKVLLHFPGCSTQSASAGGDGILHPRG